MTLFDYRGMPQTRCYCLLEEKGHIYMGTYARWYSVRDESFYTESELGGRKAPTGAPVEWVEEPSYCPSCTP